MRAEGQRGNRVPLQLKLAAFSRREALLASTPFVRVGNRADCPGFDEDLRC